MSQSITSTAMLSYPYSTSVFIVTVAHIRYNGDSKNPFVVAPAHFITIIFDCLRETRSMSTTTFTFSYVFIVLSLGQR